MHDIKDNSIGLLQPSSQDLHDKIFKLSPPLTLGKKKNSGKFFGSLPTTSLSLEITKVDIMAIKIG